MKLMKETLEKVRLGTPKAFRNLTVYPLLNGGGVEATYLTLDEALAAGVATVSEVSTGGHVPELTFTNSGTKPVLLLDGEELVGAKQNRVLNLTILAPAGKTIVIPVSCVERGRWHHVSATFKSAPRAQYAEGRAKKMEQVSESMKHGSRASNQGEVWMDLDLKFGKLGYHSPTAAMSDMFEAETVHVEEFVRAFSAEEGQVGALFAVEGKLVGFDLFDSPETFRKLFPKLLRSYGLDAVAELRDSSRSREAEPPVTPELAEAFLKSVAEAEATEFPAVGEGRDVRLKGAEVSGAALVNADRVVHLAAFATHSGRHGRVA